MDDTVLEQHLVETGKSIIGECVESGAPQDEVERSLSGVFPRLVNQHLDQVACIDWLTRHPELLPAVREVIAEHVLEVLLEKHWNALYAYGDRLVAERDADVPSAPDEVEVEHDDVNVDDEDLSPSMRP